MPASLQTKPVLERSTRQQTAILETLEGLDEFRSAQEIYLALTKKKFKVGLATVYRVLTQFEAAGLVTRHHFADGMAVFELNEGAHHDHILCLDCGHVEEFMDAGIEERQTAVAGRLGFEISEHALVIYGHCRRQECPHRSAPKV